MPKFVIEREIPGAGKMSPEELQGAAQKSNSVLHKLGPDIQWIHSYVAGDKIYCVHETEDAETIREHARCGGFPADMVVEIAAVIGPDTAR